MEDPIKHHTCFGNISYRGPPLPPIKSGMTSAAENTNCAVDKNTFFRGSFVKPGAEAHDRAPANILYNIIHWDSYILHFMHEPWHIYAFSKQHQEDITSWKYNLSLS